MKRRFKLRKTNVLLVLLVALLILSGVELFNLQIKLYKSNLYLDTANIQLEEKSKHLDEKIDYITQLEIELTKKVADANIEYDSLVIEKVNLTGYYPNDPTGSTTVTGSGLSTSNFSVNEMGWYTYKGFVVVATATDACLNATQGACGNYTSLPEGYHIFSYGDTFAFVYEGKTYNAIVLDSCGASFWNEEYQRVDIFMQSSKSNFSTRISEIIYHTSIGSLD